MALLVLIVDDNERNAKLVGDVLAAEVMSTLSATTAADGLVLAREQQPDLVLMDLRLPDLDGWEAARRLRSDQETAHIPVVALSATRVEDAGDWLNEECFSGYIEKPVDVEELPDEVRRHCGAC